MESSGKSCACSSTAFLQGSSHQRGGKLGAQLAQLPAPGCQEPSLPCSSATCMQEQHSPQLQHGQPCACRLDVLVPGHPQSPERELPHTHSCWVPWNGSSHPGAVVWDLLQLPMSGCCHPCPHHGPRTNCKDEMVVVLSGLSCSHPFVPVCARAILQWGPSPL